MTEETGSEDEEVGEGGTARAVRVAREVLARHSVTALGLIRVTLFAEACGACVRPGPTGDSDARIWRSGDKAWICVDEEAWGTPRARWSIAHELAHFLLHDDLDTIARIHDGGPKTGRDYQIEREADAFAQELLMPLALFGPYCRIVKPSMRDLIALSRRFGTSLQATAKRYAPLATSACAAVECKDGRIQRAPKSATFRAIAKQRRPIEEATFAAALMRGERVPRGEQPVAAGTWGSEKLGVEMVEHAILIPESGQVLVWLRHEPVPPRERASRRAPKAM